MSSQATDASDTPVDEDGRITDVGASRSRIPDGALVIEAGGRTVVPGLIDCHIRLWGSHEVHDVVRRSYSEVVARMLRCGQAFLESGITTARTPAAPGRREARVRERRVSRPTAPGQRDAARSRAATATARRLPASTSRAMCHRSRCRSGSPTASTRCGASCGADPRRRRLDQGDGGGRRVLADSAPDAVQYTVEEMRVMVEEAEHARLHGVMAHAENAARIRTHSAQASVDRPRGRPGRRSDRPHARRDVPLVPTFLIIEEMLREDRVDSGVTPPWAVEKVSVLVEVEPRFRHAVERGVRIAMGTDGGAGSHLPTELSLMVEHGMSPLASLRAATMDAARLLGLDGEIGTLEGPPPTCCLSTAIHRGARPVARPGAGRHGHRGWPVVVDRRG